MWNVLQTKFEDWRNFLKNNLNEWDGNKVQPFLKRQEYEVFFST